MKFNLTINPNTIQLDLNGKQLTTLTEKYHPIISSALLTAYSPFMLNFTTNSIYNFTSQLDQLNACLSDFKVATRKTSNDDKYNGQNMTYSVVSTDLIRITKSIYLLNDNPYQNRICQQLDSPFENDEIIGKFDQDCFLIEKVSLNTNEKLNKTYHCKCQDPKSCPYDFWSARTTSVDTQFPQATSSKSKACEIAGDYACFNNGTCTDPTGPVNSQSLVVEKFNQIKP